jgi:dihydroorotate dehydrogenase (NAD+) catalytic subunit
MAIDIWTRRPQLSNIIGGLSGPAIKPTAVKIVWDVSKVVKIPIIGVGGILNYKDAVEYLLAGATAIQVGTANFLNPGVTIEVIEGIKTYMRENRVKDVKDLIGAVQCKVDK